MCVYIYIVLFIYVYIYIYLFMRVYIYCILNREFGLVNLMNTPEHCSAPFHSVSSKVAKSTKMAAAHIQTYVLHVTWSILYTYLIRLQSIYIYIIWNICRASFFSVTVPKSPFSELCTSQVRKCHTIEAPRRISQMKFLSSGFHWFLRCERKALQNTETQKSEMLWP